MIFRRAVAKLRAQDWSAIVIELGIVILGVFIGTWVANWNQERAAQLLAELAALPSKNIDVIYCRVNATACVSHDSR